MPTFDFIHVTGTQYGALVVYYGGVGLSISTFDVGKNVTIYALNSAGQRGQPYYAETQKYQTTDGQTVCAAIFQNLNPDNYDVAPPGSSTSRGKKVTVFPGAIAELRF
jgi:hypothetical protein